ncbi:MAG: ABC transporter substrate-binding protein [Acidimicrobiales bacterium]
MTAPQPTPQAAPQPPTRRHRSSAVHRYGPLVGILCAIALVAVLASVGRNDQTLSASGSASSTPGSANADLPVTYDEAKASGADLAAYGDRCDPATGKIKMPTIFAPPCVPVFTGDNGGETSKGVTADTIKVVYYRPAANGDLTSLLQGLLDTPEAAIATAQAYTAMFNDLYETYGRKIELVGFDASGPATDETAARADAIKVADEIGAFASLGGPNLAQSYASELAARGVLCIGCGLGSPDSAYQKNAPYMWGGQATPEEFLLNLGDLITNRLNGKKAVFGGDDVKDKERVFGVVHFEQEVPVFKEVEAQVAEEGAKRGYKAAATETYTLDLSKAPERSRTIIAKMKEAGVTSIIFLGDPIMPISLTQAATEQNYFPEWIVTGTVLTDTSALARRYDPKQWSHAFGISSLAARTPREQVDPYKLHEWYFGQPPAAKTTNAIIFSGISQVALGIHMAGPKLTPETFRDGLFKYPPTGGGPTTPRISFGNHGVFVNPDGTERTDYLGIDDVTLIWWDPTAQGVDESGQDGVGMYRYMDGGKRYLPGQMPKTDLNAFDPAGTVLVYDQPPPEDKAPEYPPQNKPLPS